MGEHLAPPRQARLRARIAFWAAVAVASGMTIAAGRIGFDEQDGPGMTLVVLAMVTFALLIALPFCNHARIDRDKRYVTAKTVTGLRTIDLHALTRVWRLRGPSEGQTLDHLMLTDRHGVRLAVNDPEVDAAVRKALRTGEAKVSAGARRRLDGTVLPLPLRVAAGVAQLVGSALWIMGILFAVIVVAGTVGEL
ncbi:hypothetical protein [Actinokineospora sp. HUAS TT18]|uniref:hypothetical protein n=1 Tax=Actinokineospora sp. HUAS TT18 TaxID=3447451 RepID=UPI003F528677